MASLENFLDYFHSILEETDRSILAPDTKFKDLSEWNSMTALMLIAMVDENYGKKITGKEILSSSTLEELFNCVQS